MNYRSIKFRLTLWYTLAFLLAATIIFAGFFWLTGQVLFQQTDSSLISHGNKVVEVVAKQGRDMHEIFAQRAFIYEFSEIPGMLVIIMNPEGDIISSSLMNSFDRNSFAVMHRDAVSSRKYILTNTKLGNQSLRFYSSPVYANSQLLGVVLVGHPIDVIQSSLNKLSLALVATFLIMLLPTLLGGYFLAVRALRPLSAISDKLNKISSENLGERVDNPGTSDEIAHLATTFNKLLDRLNSAFKRERQFIADVTHELKTPFATQRSGLEVALQKDRSKDEYKKVIHEAIVDNHQLSATLQNILDLAWSEADQVKSPKKTVNLSALVLDMKEIAVKMADAKHIRVKHQIQSDIFVSGREDKLGRAILNCLDNAVKYGRDNGRISLSLTKQRGKAVLVIQDTGIGIAETDLPHIFDRFYRGLKTHAHLGSGLGLAISKSITDLYHGKIKVESVLNKGTTVTISFPLV